MKKSVPAILCFAVAGAISVAACSSSSTPTSTASAASSDRSAVSAPASSRPTTNVTTGPAAPGTTMKIKDNGEAPGTVAICTALMGNTELPELVGTNPNTLAYASGTMSNVGEGINKVPGCQVGIDPSGNNGAVAWAFCNMDPMTFAQGSPIGGTSNVYVFGGAANGGVIVLGRSTSLGIITAAKGSRSQAVMIAAMQDAAKLFNGAGGCNSK